MTTLTVTIPIPPMALRNNARVHWAKKSSAVKTYRFQTHMLALKACGGKCPRWKKATVQVTAYFPTARHLDPTNLIDALKSAFDGLQDAGVIEDDRDLWPLRPVIVTRDKNPRVELTIQEEI
jgi:hypothetical protein